MSLSSQSNFIGQNEVDPSLSDRTSQSSYLHSYDFTEIIVAAVNSASFPIDNISICLQNDKQ